MDFRAVAAGLTNSSFSLRGALKSIISGRAEDGSAYEIGSALPRDKSLAIAKYATAWPARPDTSGPVLWIGPSSPDPPGRVAGDLWLTTS